MDISTEDRLRRLLAQSDLRECCDETDKGVILFKKYSNVENLSLHEISNFFNISRTAIPKRLWSQLLGHTTHENSNPRLLASIHEQALTKEIEERNVQLDSITETELKEMVRSD